MQCSPWILEEEEDEYRLENVDGGREGSLKVDEIRKRKREEGEMTKRSK